MLQASLQISIETCQPLSPATNLTVIIPYALILNFHVMQPLETCSLLMSLVFYGKNYLSLSCTM
jgi:hypothetical protein